MNESSQKLLFFLGGVALGSLAAMTVARNSEKLRPVVAEVAAGAMNMRDKAVGALARTKEDVSDFMAEVEYARSAKKKGAKQDAEQA
jgi:hypothetical protein